MMRVGVVGWAAGIAMVLTSCSGAQSAVTAPRLSTSVSVPATKTSIPGTSTPRTSTPRTSLPSATATSPSTNRPSNQRIALITRGPQTRKVVALTFDAGSDTGNAARILDLLATNQIRATFGITGKWAQANPTLVHRIVGAGHQLVNHTFDHRSWTGVSTHTGPLSSQDRLEELSKTEAVFRDLTGAGSGGWFRPPYGDRNSGVDDDVAAAGYHVELMWTVDSLGWKGIPAATVVARCLGGAAPGAIMLLHVGSASTDADALPAIISGLQSAGYGFESSAEMLG